MELDDPTGILEELREKVITAAREALVKFSNLSPTMNDAEGFMLDLRSIIKPDDATINRIFAVIPKEVMDKFSGASKQKRVNHAK